MQQTQVLQKKHYHINQIDETTYSDLAWNRKQKLDRMALLKAEGCQEDIALEALNISRSSYYRWKKNYKVFGLEGLEDESKRPNNIRNPSWSREIEMRIYYLRKKYPLWGKQKITVMYHQKYGTEVSESTIGRIITKLIKQGKIQSVRFMFGKKEVKKRKFDGHAQRWKRGMKAVIPGELVQADHMTVFMPGLGEVKHFTAVCPITKWIVFKVYKQATSDNAADFLKFMQESFPFDILSVQVDGGSEFRAAFEQACLREKIPLYVLPPRSPELNGNVERGNGTARYEFYNQYSAHPSLHILRKNLIKFAKFYNTKRPHQGIGLLTPGQFCELMKEDPRVSYVLN